MECKARPPQSQSSPVLAWPPCAQPPPRRQGGFAPCPPLPVCLLLGSYPGVQAWLWLHSQRPCRLWPCPLLLSFCHKSPVLSLPGSPPPKVSGDWRRLLASCWRCLLSNLTCPETQSPVLCKRPCACQARARVALERRPEHRQQTGCTPWQPMHGLPDHPSVLLGCLQACHEEVPQEGKSFLAFSSAHLQPSVV